MTQADKGLEFVAKHLRHNYLVNVLDGSFFWLGYSFIAPGVILPLYASHFTDSKLIIGLIAMIASTGYFLPQLFTANWVEQIRVKKNLPVILGFFTERIPVLILPMTTLLAIEFPAVALISMLVLFAWHSFGAGVVAVAWNSMIAKIIPVERRGVFMGLATAIGNGTGVLGAVFASYVLGEFAFPHGYSISFGLAGLMILISWLFLAWTREAPDEYLKQEVSTRNYWKMLPSVLRRDRNLRWYLLAQTFINLGGMAWGFLAVYSAEVWALSDGKVSAFTIVMLIGQSTANLVFGFVADRLGYKVILATSVFTAILGLFLPIVINHSNWLYFIFTLRGIAFAGFFLSGLIVFEFSLADVRPTYIGINNTWIGITSVVAPMVGGLVAEGIGYKGLFGISGILAGVGLLILVCFVRDPRRN